MLAHRHKIFTGLVILIAVLSLTFPYAYAGLTMEAGHVFGGFLFNPVDGNSYLAKMYQGWRGEWRFTLPYTAEKGDGTYLFLFYILLGHISRLLSLDLRLTFHIARIIATVFMYLALYKFIKYWIEDDSQSAVAFILAAIGAGLGWLVFPLGLFTSDFWVAETYPWLSAYANPHFPLGLGLVLIILLPRQYHSSKLRQNILKDWPIGLAAALLALISPFGVVIVLVLIGVNALLGFVSGQGASRISAYDWRFLWVLLFAGPIVLYQYLVINFDPLLSAWNKQNQTPSPPLWDLIISMAPALIFAVIFTIKFFRGIRSKYSGMKSALLLIWIWIGIILLYVPFGLQRRFMMGLYVPVTILGVLGLSLLFNPNNQKSRTRLWLSYILLLVLVIPTNIVVLLAANHGIKTLDPKLYLTQGEAKAFSWLEVNSDLNALILASPDTGLFIPAHTGRRVIYGHPFETVDAEEQEAFVEDFFLGHLTEPEAISEINQRGIDLIFFGPRERSLGTPTALRDLREVYADGEVIIYIIDPIGE